MLQPTTHADGRDLPVDVRDIIDMPSIGVEVDGRDLADRLDERALPARKRWRLVSSSDNPALRLLSGRMTHRRPDHQNRNGGVR